MAGAGAVLFVRLGQVQLLKLLCDVSGAQELFVGLTFNCADRDFFAILLNYLRIL